MALLYSINVEFWGEYHLKQIDEINKIRKELNQNNQRSLIVISGSGLLIAASVVYALASSAPLIFGAPALSWAFGIVGGLFIIYGLRK